MRIGVEYHCCAMFFREHRDPAVGEAVSFPGGDFEGYVILRGQFDFIGGDEPWENEFDMSIKMQAPDGWVFKGGSLPSKMKNYLNEDGDEVSMNTADIEKDWNNTFADLQKFTIEEADSPGFSLVLAVTAATVAAFAVRRRK